MNNQHITDSQWVEFYYKDHDDAQWQALNDVIMDHVAQCYDCRQVYEKSENMRAALARAAGKLRSAFTPAFAGNAYTAAAAYDLSAEAPAAKDENTLTVTVRGRASAKFIVGSLDCQGMARQYALNAQNENRALVDDEKRLSLLLENGKIHITFNDPDFRCSVRLMANSENPPRYDVGCANQLTLELPETEFTIVEMTFTEVDA